MHHNRNGVDSLYSKAKFLNARGKTLSLSLLHLILTLYIAPLYTIICNINNNILQRIYQYLSIEYVILDVSQCYIGKATLVNLRSTNL